MWEARCLSTAASHALPILIDAAVKSLVLLTLAGLATAAMHFGEILNRADAMFAVRLTGIVIQQSALDEMLVLHVETGQSEKAGKVRGQLETLADQRAKIIAGVQRR